jgi:hypothetical protein
VRKTLLLASIAALAACGEKTPDAPTPGATPVHEHHAPHGGALQVLGEEAAHVELVLDAATGKLTAYVLDGEAEKPVRIATKGLRLALTEPAGTIWLAAVENPLTGEKVGDTSQFEGTSDKLRGVTKFGAVLAPIEVRGRTFSAAIEYPDGNEPEEKPDVRK